MCSHLHVCVDACNGRRKLGYGKVGLLLLEKLLGFSLMFCNLLSPVSGGLRGTRKATHEQHGSDERDDTFLAHDFQIIYKAALGGRPAKERDGGGAPSLQGGQIDLS